MWSNYWSTEVQQHIGIQKCTELLDSIVKHIEQGPSVHSSELLEYSREFADLFSCFPSEGYVKEEMMSLFPFSPAMLDQLCSAHDGLVSGSQWVAFWDHTLETMGVGTVDTLMLVLNSRMKQLFPEADLWLELKNPGHRVLSSRNLLLATHTFDQYDTDPKDGLLSKHELMQVMPGVVDTQVHEAVWSEQMLTR